MEPYVLMRVYNPVAGGLSGVEKIINDIPAVDENSMGNVEKRYFERLERAIVSVRNNSAKLIICDDTPSDNESGKRHRFHKSNLNTLLSKYGFENDINLFYVPSSGGEGSAMALWRLRKYFVEKTKDCSGDQSFAVLLDQDDELCPDAVKIIASKMESNAVVVSNYITSDSHNLDITFDKGSTHSKALRIFGRRYRLTSIGWTKAYSRGAMEIMVSDFEAFFKENKELKSWDTFFKKYNKYEDFLDFYVLIRKGIKIKKNRNSTHIYHKNYGSITAHPGLDDFKITRLQMLLALSQMCQNFSSELCTRWKSLLTDYIAVKIRDIEAVLEKYRGEARNGNLNLKNFVDETYPGSFAEIMQHSCGNDCIITDAITLYRKSASYNSGIKKNGKRKDEHKKNDKGLVLEVTKKERDLKLFSTFKCIFSIVGVVCISIIILFHFIEFQFADSGLCVRSIKFDFTTFCEIISIVLPVFLGIYTIMYERESVMRNKVEEEKSMKKIFFSEFKDMVRHLEANLKVLIQVKKELDSKTEVDARPASIHFENLKLPADSAIFSDKMLLLIRREIVDDITRMQINLRNMNNSAEWLKKLSEQEHYSRGEMSEAIDWEICRMIAYMVNARYMEGNQYRFANEQQLDEFFATQEIQSKLASLFLGYSETERQNMVLEYIKKYYMDRREKRRVLV